MPGLKRDLLNPTLKDILETFKLDKNYIRGEGSYLLDEAGVRYLDFIAQYGAVPFGYNPAFVWEAMEDIRARGIPSLVQPSLPGEALKLANRLAECSPGDLCYSTFCQSGTEAVEAAIKLARSATGKEIIISTYNSFHGKTLGSLSATGKKSYQDPFRAPAPGFLYISYNDPAALEEVLYEHQEKVAAFIVEPVQGEGGIIVPDTGYLTQVQEICNKHKVIFILDEIQTGLGRTGKLFACDHEGVEPDIMLLAKALGGGLLPLGVCLSSPRVWNEDFGHLHSSTFANNNLTCAVGTAVLDRLGLDGGALLQEVKAKGDYLLALARRLQELYPQVIKEVRGLGLMIGIEFSQMDDCGSYDMSFLADQGGFTALLAGFLLNVYQIRLAPFLNNSMTLRLEPPLTISYQEIDRVMGALETICKIMHLRDYACLYRYLIGDSRWPVDIRDYRGISYETRGSVLQAGEIANRKFAFVVHYPGTEDVVLNNPSFKGLNQAELQQFMEWQSGISDPGLVCHMPAVRSHHGEIAEGWLIGVPLGGREIMSLPARETNKIIAAAVDRGRELGAEIVGLGALTSVVTRGGRTVTGRQVAITSGNSFTTLMAVEGLFLGAEKMHIDVEKARGGVVGATGSIGRACALMLSEKLSQISIFGNPGHLISSRNRLNSLTKELFAYARKRRQEGKLGGLSGWLNEVIFELNTKKESRAVTFLDRILQEEELEPRLINEICAYLGKINPIRASVNLREDLFDCQLIIACSNSPEALIFSEDVSSGTVVCDVARPADVAPEVHQRRDDVLILEGGLVQYPDQIRFGPNFGYRDGVSLACLAETILLALEGECQDFSIGSRLSMETIEYLRGLAERHGFSLAGLKMGNREIDDEDIEQIYRNALHSRQSEGLVIRARTEEQG